MILGDFNFVEQSQDRWCFESSSFTGDNDRADAGHWQSVLAQPFCLADLDQPHYTYMSTRYSSRIDRIYSNHHPSWALTCEISTQVGRFSLETSDHRFVGATFRRKQVKQSPNESLGGLPSILVGLNWLRASCVTVQPSKPSQPLSSCSC